MKDHEVREFVDALTKTAREHEGCQSLREALSRVVKEHLVNANLNALKEAAPEGYEFVGIVHDEAAYRKKLPSRQDSQDMDALYGIKR